MLPYTENQVKAILTRLQKLPDEKYLELDLTIDQLRCWFNNKQAMAGVAECWKILHTGDPKQQEVEYAATLPPSDYQRHKVWLCTLHWERLWEMIIACFPRFKQIAERLKISFPFSTPLEMFTQILSEEVNSDFEVCLQPYVELSSKKAKKCLQWLSKNRSPEELQKEWETPAGRQKLEQMEKEGKAFLRQSGKPNFWLSFTMLIALILKETVRDPFIASTVKGYWQAIADVAELDAKQRRETPSVAWHKGVKKQGHPDGTYS